MSKHTPGPWTHYDDSYSVTHRHEIVAIGKTIARIYCTNGDQDADLSNARLIAAAPELLEAAQRVLAHKRGDDDWLILAADCVALEAAIAKATGETK